MRTPSLASSKDPASYAFFRGEITRAIWRIYTQRLTPGGRWFVLISAILIGYGGSSLQIQAYLIAGYLLAIWAFAVCFVLIRPWVELDVSLPQRTRAGEKVLVRATIKQRSRFRGNDLILVPHRLPESIDALPENGVPLPNLRRGESATESFHLLFKKRGLFTLKGFRVESSFPFGLLQAKRHFLRPHSVLVHPRFCPLESIHIANISLLDTGSLNASWSPSDSLEYLGNREYRTGDRFRDIDWRATARMQQTIVREWIRARQVRIRVYLDTHVAQLPINQREASFERAISMAASAIEFLNRSGYLVEFRIGEELVGLITPNNAADLDRAMDQLAATNSVAGKNTETNSDAMESPMPDLTLCFVPSISDSFAKRIQTFSRFGNPTKVVSMNPLDNGALCCELESGVELVSISQPEFETGITQL